MISLNAEVMESVQSIELGLFALSSDAFPESNTLLPNLKNIVNVAASWFQKVFTKSPLMLNDHRCKSNRNGI